MNAIGYVRWSSDEQTEGSSLERQTEDIERYCKTHDLSLRETLVDAGLSAYAGKHLDGKLGVVLQNAEAGKYRGWALVLEHSNRLSRLGPRKTFRILERLIEAGLQVHFSRGGIIRSLEDLDGLEAGLLTFVNSHMDKAHSVLISNGVCRAFDSKRKQRSAGEPVILPGALPWWLKIEAGKIVPIPSRAATVKRMFELAAQGLGVVKINQQIPDKVSHSWISKTLNNRAVLGELQPHTRNGPIGEPLLDYYPRVIPADLWQAARTEIERRRGIFQKGSVIPHPKNADKADNLFQGIIYDATDPDNVRPLWYQVRSATSSFLASAPNGTKSHRIPYPRVEAFLLDQLSHMIDWSKIERSGRSSEYVTKAAELETLNNDIQRTEARLRTAHAAADLVIDDPAVLAMNLRRIVEIETSLTSLQRKREELQTELSRLDETKQRLGNPATLQRLLSSSEALDVEGRRRLRSEIRKVISAVNLRWDTEPLPKLVKISLIFANDFELWVGAIYPKSRG